MKMQRACTVVLGCASLAMAAGMAVAQSQNTSVCGPKDPSQKGMAMAMDLSPQDMQFLQLATQSDYTEISLSTLAVQKSQNPQVEHFAQKMIEDHTRLEKKLKPTLETAGIAPAKQLNAEHQQMFDQLQGLTGKQFDQQYMLDMSQSHHATLDAFKMEEQSTQSTKLKPMVKEGERVVAMHTRMADQLSKKLGTPAGGM